MSEDRIADSIRRNAGKVCNHPNCFLPRYRVSSWCQLHTQKVTAHGHPDGLFIRPKQIDTERAAIAEFIKANLAHPGIQAALKWLQEWQEMTISNDPLERKKQPPGIDTMARLKANDVGPQQILTEVAALWLYSVWFPNRLPDDKRLTYAISRAIYNLAPAHLRESWSTGRIDRQRLSAVELSGTGTRIRETLGLLVMNIISTLQSRGAAKEKVKADFMKPFDVSNSYLLEG